MVLSATLQFWFLVRMPCGSYVLELALGLAGIRTLRRDSKALVSLFRAVAGFGRRHWIVASVLAVC